MFKVILDNDEDVENKTVDGYNSEETSTDEEPQPKKVKSVIKVTKVIKLLLIE